MSRLERTLEKKYKKRKLRFLSKVLFILLMSVNLAICIFIVDKNAKIMLGEETYSVGNVFKNIEVFLKEQIAYLDDLTKEMMAQINK